MEKRSDSKGKGKSADWSAQAKAYQRYRNSEGKSLPEVTNVMLSRANAALPFSQATGILDIECGTGSVMMELIDSFGSVLPESCSLTCVDSRQAMIEQVMIAKEQARLGSPWERLEARVADVMQLKRVNDAALTHIFARTVFYSQPSPAKCLTESLRTLKEGGVLAVSSWLGSQWNDILQLLLEVRPEKKMPALPKEWSSATALDEELIKAGFKETEVSGVVVELSFETHELLVETLLKLPCMPALKSDMSEEEMVEVRRIMVAGAKESCPDEPGTLKGWALVGVGEK